MDNKVTDGNALVGGLQNVGPMRLGGVTINPGTSSYTITASDCIIVTSGVCNPIQLPAIAGNQGRVILIVATSGLLAPASAEMIDGSTGTVVFTSPLLLFGSGSTDGWRAITTT
jgi:hypothetical protein